MFVLSPAVAQTSSEQGAYTITLYAVKGDSPYETESHLERIDSATLRCSPDGGSHKNKRAACNDLRDVNGFIDLIRSEPGYCPFEFSPVYAVAEGQWKGEARRFGKVFINRCVANRETGGAVFEI
ncbi:SSI family serine proteinase inhibitor [Streptomyces sp. NPDC093982]|uniref:SSI family serine proteinase inhibitor n=1 Tax=Streptomyces sp. NPDC093982 TaxID=3155077 RepID=UPI003431AD0A